VRDSIVRLARSLASALLSLAACVAAAQSPPYPGRDWERRAPAQEGIDPVQLQAAIDFAVANESTYPRDLTDAHYQTFGREPFGYAIGPFKPRGDMTGLVVRHGYVVAEWGAPTRVDMTFSVTKSFLSSVAGIALERGLIRSLDDPVYRYLPPVQVFHPVASGDKSDRFGGSDFIEPFDTPHNRRISWEHLLRQTSDWEGTLWGKPDWADRPGPDPAAWKTRPRAEPGTTYKYNDVRVNALALALLQVWRKPLPQVLKEELMDPIDASNRWRWYGYENSYVVLDGAVVQSVSGGGHWGGGMFIDAYDMARFGYLTLRGGRWRQRQILSPDWVRRARPPTAVQPDYGFMNWYNNRDGKLLPSAPRSAFMHIGNGTNAIYVDPDHDLVVVLRWIQTPAIDGFVQRLLASLGPGAQR
jgi:CubicO group peptidase (beta-lactamase class C family)